MMEMQISTNSPEYRINLATLQQKDPYIKTILANAKYVTLYSFQAKTNEWVKTDTEGACFVYERTAAPYHGFMILSRLATINFIEPVTKKLEFQLQSPFLLYRNPTAIYGIWFFDEKECKSFHQLLIRLIEESKEISRYGSVSETPTKVDLMQLLKKAAQSDIQNTESSSQKTEPSSMTNNQIGHAVKPMPLKRQSSATSGDKISVEELFKKADLGSNSLEQDNQTSTPRAFKRLPSENITTVSELESFHSHTDAVGTNELLTPAKLKSGASISKQELSTPVKPIPSQLVRPAHTELMSPMAFSTGAAREPAQLPIPINPPQLLSMSESLLSGFSRRSESVSSPVFEPEPVSALTKEQLKQALIYLLNTDDQFLHYIHNGYVNSLTASLRR